MKQRAGETKEEFNERAREYMRARYQKRIKAAKKALGGKCVRCGKRKGLHFDHIDPKMKMQVVSG